MLAVCSGIKPSVRAATAEIATTIYTALVSRVSTPNRADTRLKSNKATNPQLRPPTDVNISAVLYILFNKLYY